MDNQEDGRSIDQRLRDAGYSHVSTHGRHGLYKHAIWRTDDGALIGYFDARQACELLEQIGG